MPVTKVKGSKNIELIILGVVFLAAIFLYTYKLDKIPSGLYIDEALPGYNAYSLLQTAKDEYGKFFPIVLRFYGSYNPPLFTYLTIPFIWLLGLNIFAVRFASCLFGLFVAFPVYFLCRSFKVKNSKKLSIIAVLVLVISPWSFFYSRIGYEVSLGLMLFSLGVLFFFLGLKKNSYLVLAILFFSLSTYAAYTERFLVPIFLIASLSVFRKFFFKNNVRNYIYKLLTIAFILEIPHLTILFKPAFFPKSDLFFGALAYQANELDAVFPHWLSLSLSFAREFLSQYLSYFSPRNLFFLPDSDMQRSIPELSVFYFWMIVPYFVGLYALWKDRKSNWSKLVMILLLTAPIPAAMTKDPFSTHRALPLLFPMVLTIALGISKFGEIFSKKVFIPVFTLLIFMSLLLLWRSYFVFLPKEKAKYWGYGTKELAKVIESTPNEHFVIDQARIKPIYIQLAFFLKYSPDKFQEISQEMNPGILENYYNNPEFNSHYQFANLETRNVDWKEDIYKKQILVGDSLTFSETQAKEHSLSKSFEIKDPLDEIVFVGYKTNPDAKCESDPLNIHCRK